MQYPRCQILTLKEILKGKRFQTPSVVGRGLVDTVLPGISSGISHPRHRVKLNSKSINTYCDKTSNPMTKKEFEERLAAFRSGDKAALQGADLREANLRGANLAGAQLQAADLEGANLDQANLRGADLRKANLRWANLLLADMGWANLKGANWLRAKMTGVNWDGAKLNRAN